MKYLTKKKCNKYGRFIFRKKNDYVGISSFTNDLADFDFALDDNLNNKEFRLVYDSDPDWGDDEDDDKINVSPVRDKDFVSR